MFFISFSNGNQQLFDIEEDPKEMTNLINDEKYAGVKDKLYAKLLALQKEVGDTLTIRIR